MQRVKEILDRVRTWTPEQQEQLVRAVELIEENESDLRLDEDEAAGVRQAPGA